MSVVDDSACTSLMFPPLTTSAKIFFLTLKDNAKVKVCTRFFKRQLDFPSEPGVANEILENEPTSCLTVA